MNMILYMSLSGSVLIGLILLLRRAAGFFPGRMLMLLWDLVLVRLLAPIYIPMPFSLMFMKRIQAADAATAAPWFAVWISGAAVSAAVMAYLYLRDWRILREALPAALTGSAWPQDRKIRVLVSDRIPTPVVCGLLRPRIILPKGYGDWDQQTCRYVLTHEWLHIRWLDNLQKLAAGAAVCVHWFNPLVWIMQAAFDRDLEKACDEKVIRQLGEKHRDEYARTLLNLAAAGKGRCMSGNGFSRSAVHERIRTLTAARKPGPAAAVVCSIVLAVSFASFTGPGVRQAQLPLRGEETAVIEIDLDTGETWLDGRSLGVIDVPEGAQKKSTAIAVTGMHLSDGEFAVEPASAAGSYWIFEPEG